MERVRQLIGSVRASGVAGTQRASHEISPLLTQIAQQIARVLVSSVTLP